MIRLHLDPLGGEGGASSPGDYVTLTREAYHALLAGSAPGGPAGPVQDDGAHPTPPARLAADPTEARGKPGEREAHLAEELAARDRKLADLERAHRAALRDRALAVALCGRPLVSGAAGQLIKLLRDDFDVHEEGGDYRVSARDGRAIDQAVNELLGTAEYAHFCLPTSRGGAGVKEGHRPASAGTPEGAPRNLGEAIVLQWRKEAVTRANNPNLPIGLGRRR